MRLIRLRVKMVEETITRQRLGNHQNYYYSLLLLLLSLFSIIIFSIIYSFILEREKTMAEESNKMKTQFLANLSHEVRY